MSGTDLPSEVVGIIIGVLLVFASSVAAAWFGLYKLRKVLFRDKPIYEGYWTPKLLAWLLLLSLLIVYTICTIPWLFGMIRI